MADRTRSGAVDLPVSYLYNVLYDGQVLSERGGGEYGMTWSASRRMLCSMTVLSGLTVFLPGLPGWTAAGGMEGPSRNGWADLSFVVQAGERAPYGVREGGEYGERREVSSLEQARKILLDYFSKKDVKIGKITEKNLYFEAEIRDRDGKLVDTVIVDKRTGRIRSIY